MSCRGPVVKIAIRRRLCSVLLASSTSMLRTLIAGISSGMCPNWIARISSSISLRRASHWAGRVTRLPSFITSGSGRGSSAESRLGGFLPD
ncbi:hypothetical protein N8683_02425 [bacterium]|nr:hypothetical protein [bacterium]